MSESTETKLVSDIDPTKDVFPCSTCSWVGCVIWYKYIRKTPPVSEAEHAENKRLMNMFHDVLTLTGCKRYRPSEYKLSKLPRRSDKNN
jgi:hypothetical protein